MRRTSPSARFATASLGVALGLVARAAGAADPEPPLPSWAAVPSASAPAPRDPITLDFGLRWGFGYRPGDGAGLPVTGRYGGVLGASIAVAPSRSYSIGLGYEHSALGREHGAGDLADVQASRTVDVVWASARLTFVRFDRSLMFAQLGPGLAFQSVDADVTVYPAAGARLSRFSCQHTAGPGFGLRAGVGVETSLTRRLALTVETVLDNLHLSSDPLGSCAPGAGTVSTVGLRVGFTYRLDVTRALR